MPRVRSGLAESCAESTAPRPCNCQNLPGVRECEGGGEVRVQAEIDERLLSEIRKLAQQQGRSERELLEEAIRRYLREPTRRSGSLEELFERIDRGQRERGVEPLSEEEAERLAYEELHAMRRERKAAR